MATVRSSIPLTAIKGIGPVTQRRLQQALSVETAQDLLGFNVDRIQTHLAEVGPKVPKRDIQQWLQRASNLIAAEQSIQTESGSAVANQATLGSPEEDFDEEINEMILPSSPPALPTLLSEEDSSAFQVSICDRADAAQVAIEHINSGECYELDPSIAADLYQWMTDRLEDLTLPLDQVRSPADEPSSEPLPASDKIANPVIEIVDVSVAPLATDDTWAGFLSTEQAFALSVSFRAIPTQQSPIPRDTIAVAQFHARNRLTGEVLALGIVQDRLQHDGNTQRLQSAPVMLENAGIYQIQALVTLQDVRAAAGYQELQFIQIM